MKCKICNTESVLVLEKMQGYIEGIYFDVYECSNCKCQFVSPMENLEDTYNKIYGKENSESVYNFYYNFAKGIRSLRRPLKVLREFNPIYWSVISKLENFTKDKNVKILEVGSGLGYFVDALRREGYSAQGLEYSSEANDYAKINYGNYFTTGTVEDFSLEHKEEFDVIISTEVIEHVTDPLSFASSVMKMIKKGGIFIFTTPNKDIDEEGAIWHNDKAPIHLWWMTRKTIEEMATQLSVKFEIQSFKEYKKIFLYNYESVSKNFTPDDNPILDKNGLKINSKISFRSLIIKYIPAFIYIRLVHLYHKFKFLQKGKDSNDMTYIISSVFYK